MTRKEALEQLRLGPGINEDVSEEYDEATDMAIEALELILDNATNGDVIKALFPDAGQPHFYGVKNGCFDADWWNAPYKAESEG